MDSIFSTDKLVVIGTSFIRFAIGIGLLLILQQLVIWWYRRAKKIEKNSSDNFIFGIQNIFKAIITLLVFIFFFSLFGIDFKSLLTSLSIVAAAMVLIFKEYITDFLAGLYFGFSRDFEIGDYISTNGMKGKVIELNMFKTKLLNDDDDFISLPNIKIYNSELINYTKRDISVLSIDFQIMMEKVKGLETLEDELVKSLEEYYDFLELDSFNLKIVKMEKDAMNLKFQYQLKKIDQKTMKDIRRKTVRRIFNYISEV